MLAPAATMEWDTRYRSYDDEPDWKASWEYGIGVNFPEKLVEKYLRDEEECDEEDE